MDDYIKYAVDAENQVIAIAHCDCKNDAMYIADRIRNEKPPKDIIIRVYDRCSGAHVGPGGICIFFVGKDRDFK